jgi:hypothetical protein
MAVDDQVRELLREVTPHPDVAIDVDQVRRGARRRTSAMATLAAGLVVVLLVGGAFAVRIANERMSPEPTPLPVPVPQNMVWQRVPDMPLSPRWDPFTVWTGSEALVIGGLSGNSTGGIVPFPVLRDGAAFDPATATWRRIDDAPVAIGSRSFGPSLVVNDTVVVVRGRHWLAYDVGDDRWRVLPGPPVEIPQPTLAADPGSGRVYAVDKYVDEGEDAPVQVLDLDADTWSSLPASTHELRLDDRSLVMTSAGLVMMGGDLFPRRAGRQQENAHAELWTGQGWSRFPDSDVNGSEWHWTGSRVISTYRITRRDSNRGGLHEFRAGALDPTSGEWSALPWLPGHGVDLLAGGWPSADGALVFGEGYLYDDSDGSSRPVRPPDATVQQSGVVLGDSRLMAFGGYHVKRPEEMSRVVAVQATDEAWMMAVG